MTKGGRNRNKVIRISFVLVLSAVFFILSFPCSSSACWMWGVITDRHHSGFQQDVFENAAWESLLAFQEDASGSSSYWNGCGIIWYADSSQSHVYRMYSMPWNSENEFEQWNPALESNLIHTLFDSIGTSAMVHFRQASGGGISDPNPHPFVYSLFDRDYSFQHNGTVEGQDWIGIIEDCILGEAFFQLPLFQQREYIDHGNASAIIDSEYLTAVYIRNILIAENYGLENAWAIRKTAEQMDDMYLQNRNGLSFNSINGFLSDGETTWAIVIPHSRHYNLYYQPLDNNDHSWILRNVPSSGSGNWNPVQAGTDYAAMRFTTGEEPYLHEFHPSESRTEQADYLTVFPAGSSRHNLLATASGSAGDFMIAATGEYDTILLRWYNQTGLSEELPISFHGNHEDIKQIAIRSQNAIDANNLRSDYVLASISEDNDGSNELQLLSLHFESTEHWSFNEVSAIELNSSGDITSLELIALNNDVFGCTWLESNESDQCLLRYTSCDENQSEGVILDIDQFDSDLSLSIQLVPFENGLPLILLQSYSGENLSLTGYVIHADSRVERIELPFTDTHGITEVSSFSARVQNDNSLLVSFLSHDEQEDAILLMNSYHFSLNVEDIACNLEDSNTIPIETSNPILSSALGMDKNGIVTATWMEQKEENDARLARFQVNFQRRFETSEIQYCPFHNPAGTTPVPVIILAEPFRHWPERDFIAWELTDESSSSVVARFTPDPWDQSWYSINLHEIQHSEPIDVREPQENPSLGTFVLYPNWPNPFNQVTNISVEIPITAFIQLRIHDLLGRHVSTIYQGTVAPGVLSFRYQPEQLSSGTYYVIFSGDSFIKTQRIVLIK